MKNVYDWFIGFMLTAFVSFAPFMGIVGRAESSNVPSGYVPLVFAEDIYSFQMALKVPQVLDNATSQGYRKFQTQKIVGDMIIQWKTDTSVGIAFNGLVNRNFKVAAKNVSYKGECSPYVITPSYTYIGSYKKNTFLIPALAFYAEFLPSYATSSINGDNSFILVFAAKGTSTMKKKIDARIAATFQGAVTGTQGCGCMDYGHVSPTRKATYKGASDIVLDAVATYGTWKAKWKTRRVAE